jgi:hypothetical protein
MSLLDRLRRARLASLGAIAMSPSACAVRIAGRYGIAHGEGPRRERARAMPPL